MTDHSPTADEVRKSIVPKSDQLNADDLIAGPITVRIEQVRRGDKDQPIIVEISGHPGRPYKPCKSMRRVLIAAYSDDAAKWIGQRMTLFCDPNVLWAGVRVGGIRISHLSGLDAPRTFLLTHARGKRAEVTIHPLAEVSADHQAAIDAHTQRIAEANTLEELKAVGFLLKNQPKPVQDAVRGVYASLQKALSAQPARTFNDATLAEWKSGIDVMTTLESCTEFRQTLLSECPAEIREAVEKLLAEKEASFS